MNDEEIDLLEVSRILLEGKKKIFLICIFCMLLAIIYIMVAPRVYQSTARLHVQPTTVVSNEGSVSIENNQQFTQRVNTYVNIINGQDVAEVVKNIEKSDKADGSNHLMGNFVPLQVSAKAIKNTEIIEITVTGNDSQEAQQVNQFFIDSLLKKVKETTDVEMSTINGELSRVNADDSKKDQIKSVETKIEIISPASLNTQPTKPKRMITLVLSLVIGILLGCGCTIAQGLWTRKIYTKNTIEEQLQLPVLGIVSEKKDSVL